MSKIPSPADDKGTQSTNASAADPSAGPGAAEPPWVAPWVASPAHPEGAADQPAPPQTATGHYGPGYSDPARHYGGTLPGRPDAAAADPVASGPAANPAVSTPPADPPSASHPGDAPNPASTDPDRPPDLRSDEVGLRPPDHAPSASAPESENAALIFERS